MLANCVKLVKKSVQKSAQKSWMKNVQKCSSFNLLHVLNKFCRFFDSFTQFVLTSKNRYFNLLSGEFYTFSTYTTNTTNYIKEGN